MDTSEIKIEEPKTTKGLKTWQKIALGFGILLLLGLIGFLTYWFGFRDKGESGGGQPTIGPTLSPPAPTQSALFLISAIGDSDKPYIIPIPISKNNSENQTNASHWNGYGKKMGITPNYSNNTYKISLSNSIAPNIKAISFVSTSKSGVSPDVGSTGVKLYNYLYTQENSFSTGEISLYINGTGASGDITGPASDMVMNDVYGNGSDYLLNMANDNLESIGYCTERNRPVGCNDIIPMEFPN